MKNKGKKIFSGALSLTASALLVKLLGVIYKVPLSYILTDVGMGYFNTAYTVYGFFYVLCSAGVPKAITCIISEEEAKGRKGGYYIYRYALRLFALLGVGIIALYLALSPLIVRLISNPSSIYTMLFIGPSILFVATGGVCRGFLTAKGRLIPIAVAQVIEAVCKLVLGLVLARFGISLGLNLKLVSALAVLGITLGSIFSTVYLIICAKKKNNGEKERQNLTENGRELAKRIFKIATPITLGSSVLTFSSIIDMTIIMRCLIGLGYSESYANEMYGNYTTLAVPMVNLIISLIFPLTVYLLPQLVRQKVEGDADAMRSTVNGVIKISMAFVCPCVVIFGFYSFDVLDVLFTSAQSVKGYQLLAVLSVGIVFLTLLNVINTVHEALGHFGVPTLSLATGVIVKLLVEPFMILKTPLGILGVPLSTVLSYAAGVIVSALCLVKHLSGVRVLRYAFLPILASVICFGIPYYTVFSQGVIGQRPFGLLLLLSLCFVVYLVLIFAFHLLGNRAEKVKINKKIVT